MSQQEYATCVIGKTLLAIDCSRILIRNGFSITLVFTDDPMFDRWASSIQIPVKNTKVFLKSDTDFSQFDYLFSIVNEIIIPSNILKAIRKLSINYHNGPLPKYAGANATHWALIKGEKKHGITWHVMEEIIDTGSILAMEDFVIDDSDNFLNVSWKCKEAAERTLSRLCLQLKVNGLCRQERQLCYKVYEKPTPFCILPLHVSAPKLYDFWRGTFHLKNHPATTNELGLPKIFLQPYGRLVIVAGLEVEDRPAIESSGTIVSVMDDYVRIATASNYIVVDEFLELDGSAILKPFSRTLAEIKDVNLALPEMLNVGSDIWKFSDLCGKYERTWVKYLSHHEDVIPLVWPYYAYADVTSEPHALTLTKKILFRCEGEILANLEQLHQEQASELLVLSAFVAFLLAMTPSFAGCIDVMCNNIPKMYAYCFLQYMPVAFVLKPEQSLKLTILELSKLLAKILQGKKSLVASDVYLRYPIEQPKCSVAVAIPSDPDEFQPIQLSAHKITIFSYRRGKNIAIAALFCPQHFHEKSFKTVEADFCAFLNSAYPSSDKPISSHPLCSQHTEDTLLNNSTLKGPNIDIIPVWLHEPFLHSVELFPNAIAIVDKFGQYTFSEVNNHANKIASVLLKLADGVAIKTVALVLKRTWECIASMLAVSMVGACFVPIDPDFPNKHMNFILEDSNADAVIVDEASHCYGISGRQYLLISLDVVSRSNQLANLCFELPLTPKNAAVIMYTSGTTGKPKGVIIEHVGLCNILSSYMSEIGYTKRTTVGGDTGSGEFQIFASSVTFDSCFLDIFPALWSGGTVLVLPTSMLEKSRCFHFLQYITFVHTQPVKLSFFNPKDFASATNISFGGEAPTIELLEPWKLSGRKLWNVYGPTEISVITTICNVQNSIHLGKCTGNALLKILNPQKQLVPFGVAGELHVGGKGVGRYTSKQLTLKAFWKDECTGMRFYRTGDLVYLDEDYTLHFIGRIPKDKQKKIGGVRIELMGVQHALRQLPGIQFAHVVEEKYSNHTNRLAAYISPHTLDPLKIKAALCEKLPKEMVPSMIIPVPRSIISFSSAGKLRMDRSKFRSNIPSPNYVPPSSDIEKQIVSLYHKCLGIENEVSFGMNDKFSDFGGDSVAAVHLVNEIRSLLKWDVQPSDIVQLTPSELTAKNSPGPLHLQNKSTPHMSELKSSPGPNKDTKYLTSMQKALLSMNKISLGPTYNIPITFQISGKASGLHIASALEKALSILREALWDEYSKNSAISSIEHVMHIDLCSLPLEEGTKCALGMVQQDAVSVIDVNKSHFRCSLYYLSSDCWILSLVIHHLAFDYSSWGCLQQLIEYSYSCNFSAFQEKWVPFHKFVQYDQQEYEKSNFQIINFWTNHLKECQLFVNFPTTFPRPRHECYRGQRMPLKFDLSAHNLLNFCEALEVDPASFFLSTFAVLIYNLSHEHSFGIGVSISRRVTADMKKIVGLLVNTIVCCFPLDKLQDSFANLLQYVHTWHKEALRYSSVHFQNLVSLCAHDSSDAAHHIIPQFYFNYISEFQQPSLQLGSDIDADFLDIQTYTAKAELALDVHSLGDCFECILEYNTALFSKSAMDALIQKYAQLMDYFLYNSYDTGFPQIYLPDMAAQASPTITISESAMQCHTNFPLSDYQLSLYKELIEIPIDLTTKFHATCSLKVTSNTGVEQVKAALCSVAGEYPYLKSSISTDNSICLKVQPAIVFQVYSETVSSEIELEAVRIREQQWPFDIFTAPLFRCILIRHSFCTKTELFFVVHQLLLNEVSVRMFAKLLNASLMQKSFPVLDRRTCLSESTPDSDSALQYWAKYLSKLEQPVSFSTSQVSHHTSIEEDCNIPFQSEKELQVLCCAFTSLFTWELQKTPQLQFCTLWDTPNKLQASENLLPISVEIDTTKSLDTLCKSLHDYISEASLHPLPSYWKLQEHLNPFTSILHPYHEILLQIVNLPHCSDELSHLFLRSFKIIISFKPLKKKVTLTTYLNTQQTMIAHQCLKSLLSVFSIMMNTREESILYWLPKIQLPVSKLSGGIQDILHSLKEMLQSALSTFPFSVAFCDCTGVVEANIPCILTYTEASKYCHQLAQHIHSVREKSLSCDSYRLAILTSGGFEQPLATIAAVLSGYVFLLLDPLEDVSLLVEKLTLANVSLLLYDFKSLSIAEKIVSQQSHLRTLIVDLYYIRWEEASSSTSFGDDENTPSKTSFIVFTSGTTGKPKGIPVLEKSLCNFLLWFNSSVLPYEHLWWIQFIYPCMDVYVAEILTQLLHGNTLVLINREHKLNFFYTFNIMRSYSIQGICVIPTLLTLMLNKVYCKRDKLFCWNSECLPHLRHVYFGGETLPKHTCNTFFQRFPPSDVEVLLHNLGGPAECAIAYAHCILNNQQCLQADAIPMGHLIPNSELRIVNPHSLQSVPLGMLGEVIVSGLPIFHGYIDNDAKSSFFIEGDKIWYHTGDIGYIDEHHQVVLLHRLDTQVKLNGQRISTSGIQKMICHLNLPNLDDVIVDVIQKGNVVSLICFPIITGDTTNSEKEIQESLIKFLPKKYVPLVIKCYNSSTVPRLLSGKTDLKTLRKVATTKTDPRKKILTNESIPILQECLTRLLPYSKQMESTNWLNMSLDSLGLSSVHKAQLHQMLLDMKYPVKMSSILMSQNFYDLASRITTEQRGRCLGKNSLNPRTSVSALPDNYIAIIAMEVNVPGASNCEEFWRLISNGIESISHNLPCVMLPKPQDPEGICSHYVGSRGLIDNCDMFDAKLFNVLDIDAQFMDPQQRLLLHAVWTSLEKAGYDPFKFSENAKIGCFAGTQFPSYMLNCLKSSTAKQCTDQIVWGCLRDNVALRIGKYFNFTGPCITIANNCATFAVALHYARCSLLMGECDLAVVAAASVSGENTGYIVCEGDINSQDGHCCPFSQSATGTVMSDGVTVIILRRLTDAKESGDKIACCIKTSAIGSDGARIKTKQYVPAAEGQADVLRMALHSIEPRTIGMIEAHGTGTRLGDEIELESLNSVFQQLWSGDTATCIIGSVKGNIGHLGVASAGAGIVKASLALKHVQLPPSINCNVPIHSMSKTPFVILQKTRFWQSSGPHPRRALVHSIGAMGTNSAIILEEYRPPTISQPQLINVHSEEKIGYPVCISAKTPKSLVETCKLLAQYLSQRSVSIKEFSFTLLIGRQFLPVRRGDVFDCLTKLRKWLITSYCTKSNGEVLVCIAFSGQGSLIEMSFLSKFCQFFPTFKQRLEMYSDFLVQKHPSHDQAQKIKKFIYTGMNSSEKIQSSMKPTFHHPLIIMSQLSLYHLLIELGLKVNVVLGHSLGEYTAACVAGIFSPEQVLELVYQRALLIENFVPKGKMMSVQISAQELQQKYINSASSLEIACYNSTTQSVISGSPHDIEYLKSKFNSDRIKYKVLQTEYAYHHSGLRNIRSKFEAVLKAEISKQITTNLITTLYQNNKVHQVGSILSPDYWIKQLDTPVDFISALEVLHSHYNVCHQASLLQVVECGVQPVLNHFIAASQSASVKCTTFTLKVSHKTPAVSLAKMWEAGVNIKLHKLALFTGTQKLTLPTYVFDTYSYWIAPDRGFTSGVSGRRDEKSVVVAQGWDFEAATVEQVLALINTFTGPGYDEQFPQDSMFQTFIREKILEISNYKVDINHLLQQNATPRKVAEYVASELKSYPPKPLDDKYQIVKCLTPGQKDVAKACIFIVHAVAGN